MADWKKDHIPDPRDTSFTEDLGKAEGTIIDDPRAILKVAGAECAEVETFYGPHSYADEVDVSACFEEGDAAILAVARLAAELKRQLDDRTERVKQAIERSRVTAVSPQEVLDLIDRIARLQDDEKRDAYLVEKYKWLAEHDIQIVPKDDWHTPGEPDQVGGFAVERRAGFVLTRLQRRWDARQL